MSKPLCKETGDTVENTCILTCISKCSIEQQDECFGFILECGVKRFE